MLLALSSTLFGLPPPRCNLMQHDVAAIVKSRSHLYFFQIFPEFFVPSLESIIMNRSENLSG